MTKKVEIISLGLPRAVAMAKTLDIDFDRKQEKRACTRKYVNAYSGSVIRLGQWAVVLASGANHGIPVPVGVFALVPK